MSSDLVRHEESDNPFRRPDILRRKHRRGTGNWNTMSTFLPNEDIIHLLGIIMAGCTGLRAVGQRHWRWTFMFPMARRACPAFDDLNMSRHFRQLDLRGLRRVERDRQ